MVLRSSILLTSLLILYSHHVVQVAPELTPCDLPATSAVDPPPLPTLPEQFTALVEAKIVNVSIL